MPGNFLKNDLAALLRTTDFAVTAVYDGTIITGIFDDEDVDAQMADGTIRIVSNCTFTGRSDDFSGIAEGDTIVISSITYVIRSWRDDGTGEIELMMEKQ